MAGLDDVVGAVEPVASAVSCSVPALNAWCRQSGHICCWAPSSIAATTVRILGPGFAEPVRTHRCQGVRADAGPTLHGDAEVPGASRFLESAEGRQHTYAEPLAICDEALWNSLPRIPLERASGCLSAP